MMHHVDGKPSETDATDSSARDLQPSILGTLADDDMQAILSATATEPKSVPEIVAECDIPTPTAYRKVDVLEELGLLDEQVRTRPGGRNSAEYCLNSGEISITFDGADGRSIEY